MFTLLIPQLDKPGLGGEAKRRRQERSPMVFTLPKSCAAKCTMLASTIDVDDDDNDDEEPILFDNLFKTYSHDLKQLMVAEMVRHVIPALFAEDERIVKGMNMQERLCSMNIASVLGFTWLENEGMKWLKELLSGEYGEEETDVVSIYRTFQREKGRRMDDYVFSFFDKKYKPVDERRWSIAKRGQIKLTITQVAADRLKYSAVTVESGEYCEATREIASEFWGDPKRATAENGLLSKQILSAVEKMQDVTPMKRWMERRVDFVRGVTKLGWLCELTCPVHFVEILQHFDMCVLRKLTLTANTFERFDYNILKRWVIGLKGAPIQELKLDGFYDADFYRSFPTLQKCSMDMYEPGEDEEEDEPYFLNDPDGVLLMPKKWDFSRNPFLKLFECATYSEYRPGVELTFNALVLFSSTKKGYIPLTEGQERELRIKLDLDK